MNNLNSIVDYLKVFNNINKRPAQEPRNMAQEPRNMAQGGRLGFDKGGAAKFREFIQNFDEDLYKGFIIDNANKYKIDRGTAADIITQSRPDLREKLDSGDYITRSQLEGGKSYEEKIQERVDRVAKKNISTPAEEEFIELFEDFKKDTTVPKKTRANFAKYLNNKGKTAFGGIVFNEESVGARLERLGIDSPITKTYTTRLSSKDLRTEANKVGIDTKGLNDEVIRNKIYEKRAGEIKKIKRLTDPEWREKEKQSKLKWEKANPEKLKQRNYEQRWKQYKKFGMAPPVKEAKEELWRNLFMDGQKYQKGRRLKTIGSYSRYIPKDKFFNAKILDTKTNKIITFGKDGKDLEKYINKYTPYKYEQVLKPYAQKWFINDTKGLRDEINSKLITNWTKSRKDNFFEVQHNSGRFNDPFDVSLTNKDINLDESTARRRFEKIWDKNTSPNGKIKVTSEVKEAFRSYKNDLPKEILSKPSMVKRTRYFGEDIPFDEQLRQLKAEGVELPYGTLKKAKVLSNFWCGTRKASGGRVSFASGSGCPDSVKKKNFLILTDDVAKGRVTGEAAEQIAKNAGKVVAKAGSKSVFASIFGPAGIGIDIAYEVGSVGIDMYAGKPWKEAVQDNWIAGAFMPGTGQEEFHKRLFEEYPVGYEGEKTKKYPEAKPYGSGLDLKEAYDKKQKQIDRLKAETTYRGKAEAERQLPGLERDLRGIAAQYNALGSIMEEGSPEYENYMAAVTEARDADKAKSKATKAKLKMELDRPTSDRAIPYKRGEPVKIDFKLPKPVEISKTPLNADQLQEYAEYHRNVGDLEPRGELPQWYVDEIQNKEKWRQLFEQRGIRGSQDWKGATGGIASLKKKW